MTLNTPFEITPRLMPGLKIGEAWVQLEYSSQAGRDGRTRYHWMIDLADGQEFEGEDLQSGVGKETLQAGFESLLTFLGAFAAGGENDDLFPAGLRDWAEDNMDEFTILEEEIHVRRLLVEN